MKNATKENQPKTPEQIMQELHEHLNYWQRELRLDDIDINIRWMIEFEEERDQNGDNRLGFMFNRWKSHQAELVIIHPSKKYSHYGLDFNEDYEVILVHELLHVCDLRWFTGVEIIQAMEDERLNEPHEIVIDTIAEALVRARRGIRR